MRPRFDGLYVEAQRPQVTHTGYMRFLDTGQVCCASSATGSTAQVARWLTPDHEHVSSGVFDVVRDTLSMILVSVRGAVSYTGTISADGEWLYLDVRSFINGHESYGAWRFSPGA